MQTFHWFSLVHNVLEVSGGVNIAATSRRPNVTTKFYHHHQSHHHYYYNYCHHQIQFTLARKTISFFMKIIIIFSIIK